MLRDQSPHVSIFWACASSKPRFEQAYQHISKKAKIPGTEGLKADMLKLTGDWLASNESGQWLLIVDGADDAGMFFCNSNASAQGENCQQDDVAWSTYRPRNP